MVLFFTESEYADISADAARDHRLFLLREIGCCVGIVFGLAFGGSGARGREEGRPTLSNISPTARWNRWAMDYLTNL